MIARLVLSVVVGVVVGLGCLLLGRVLDLLTVPLAITVGGFLIQWGWVLGWVLGLLAGIWYFFTGGGFQWPRPNPPQ